MKKISTFITVLIFLNCCSVSKFQSDYVLVKKYPPTLPELNIAVINDSCAEIFKTGEIENKTIFIYTKHDKYSVVVKEISNVYDYIPFNIGDTIVHYKKELYLFNEKHKLVFRRKR